MTPPGRPLRIAVIGAGHLGKIHTRILAELSGVELVRVVDCDAEAARESGEKHGVPHGTDLVELFGDELDGAVVVVPTAHHLEVAEPLLQRGIACLVEKPMATSLEEADRMIAIARESGATLQIGHVERFNPAIDGLKEHPLDPLFIEVHRQTPFTFRSTDVSVVLDLMIHDLDLVLSIVDAPLTSIDAVGGSIFSPAADVVSARLRFESGVVANLTASRISLNPMRRFRVFSRDCYFSLDLAERQGLLVTRGPRWDERGKDLKSLDPAVANDRQQMMDFVFKGLLKVEEFRFDPREPLKEELLAFIAAVRSRGLPAVSGEEGRKALALAIAVEHSIASDLRR